MWGRRSTPPPEMRRSPWPWGRETLGKQDSLPWHEQQGGGKTSVTRSLCGEMEAWLLRRHEGTTRAEARAPLLGRNLGREHACPEPLVPRRQHLLGHLSLGQICASRQTPTLNSKKQLPEMTGSQMPSSSRMWKLGGATGFKRKEWVQTPKSP